MRKAPTKDERAEKIDNIIRIAYDSLQTHLPYTHNVRKKELVRNETVLFHRTCVKDYARIILLASELY